MSCVSLAENNRAELEIGDYYKSEDDLNGSCISIYPGISMVQYYRLLNSLGCIAVTTDNRFVNHSRGVVPSSDSYIQMVWDKYYQCIAKANFAIDNIALSEVDENIKNKYLAEAKTLRAFLYLRLVKLWGDIPYYEHFDITTDDMPPTAMKDVYDNIIRDLEWSINYIHEDGWDRTRIDNSVAKAILADAYITCATSAKMYNPGTSARALKPYYTAYKDCIDVFYTRVKTLTSEIMSSNVYSLIKSEKWSDLWGLAPATDNTVAYDHRNNEEFLWSPQTIIGLESVGHGFTPVSCEYSPAHTGMFQHVAYQYVTSMDRKDVRFKEFIWGYAKTKPMANGNYQYLKYRRDLNNPGKEIVATGDTVINACKYKFGSFYELFPKKFYDKTFVTSGMGGEACVIPYYRMAEIYLWYTEAENELNGMSKDAVSKINKLRHRVGLSEYNENQFSQKEFRDRIIDEYLWEFCLEGKDYHVITRFGKLKERCRGVETTRNGQPIAGMNPDDPRPRDAENYWLPYPLSEKQLNRHMTEYRMKF